MKLFCGVVVFCFIVYTTGLPKTGRNTGLSPVISIPNSRSILSKLSFLNFPQSSETDTTETKITAQAPTNPYDQETTPTTIPILLGNLTIPTEVPPTSTLSDTQTQTTTILPNLVVSSSTSSSTDSPVAQKKTSSSHHDRSGHNIPSSHELSSSQHKRKVPLVSYDPCAPFVPPPTPDFRAPGRRISEVKCYEYIWQMKVRSDKAGQDNECQEHRLRGISSYIVGGHYTFSGDYPNMGAIGWKAVVGTWKFMCGCTLISSKFVLTAAHCSSASSRDTTIADTVPKIVRLGDKNIQDIINGTQDETIIRIINHPKYKSPKQYFDICLMELGRKLTFTTDIQPACLWTKQSITKYGDEAQVTGWGVVESGTVKTSPELLAATVDIIDFAKCNRLLHMSCNRNWCGLQPDQLCAGKLGGGVDACQGDSGGPLQVKIPLPILTEGTMHYVIGVTSFGVGCALPGLPGVYTKVSSFIDWIESVVWPGHNGTTTHNDVPDLGRFERSVRF
ncbi:hypothetical protein B5X24_HaOG206307 [Helicoverpa armigera]|nr:hypothetical protein B5X24_HaOG206307 [Helicoverpa armigera]